MFTTLANPFFGVLDLAPELEVISREPKQAVSDTPLLFVHGAFTGAWCWDEFFLPYLAEQGWNAHALSLRGHGRSRGRRRLHQASIRNYVTDVKRIADQLERPPVVIGHSMGGMVVQKYLELYGAPGAALMASVPPTGLAVPSLELMLGDPWLFTQISVIHQISPSLVDFQAAKRAVFSDDVPQEELLRYQGRFHAESQRAIWDMMGGDLPRRWLVERCPMLVMGAENDALFTVGTIEATARTYHADCEIFPNMSHGMMLERRWRDVADRFIEWLVKEGF